MKSKKRPSRLPEEWETVPGTHEGIVTQKEFDTVQQLMTSRRREKNQYGYDNVFLGVLICADCGYAMRAASANRRKRPDIINCVQYTCNNFGRYGNVHCTSHTIEARDLLNAVMTDINEYARLAVNDEKAVKTLQQRLSKISDQKAREYGRERRRLEKRVAELDKLFAALYEDKVLEKITERNYRLMAVKYEQEQMNIEARLSAIDAELLAKGRNDKGIADFVERIREYKGITALTARIVNELIDRITVSERIKTEGGGYEQHIRIYYKFVWALDSARVYEVTPRRCLVPDKACQRCGEVYSPLSNVAKYCPTCRPVVRKQQEIESSKRRVRNKKRQNGA